MHFDNDHSDGTGRGEDRFHRGHHLPQDHLHFAILYRARKGIVGLNVRMR